MDLEAPAFGGQLSRAQAAKMSAKMSKAVTWGHPPLTGSRQEFKLPKSGAQDKDLEEAAVGGQWSKC